jgi:hypothetical protein
MGMTQSTSAIMVFLTGLLPASCHKTAPQQKAPTTPVIAIMTTNSPDRVLGEITLTNHNETSFQLPTGESCTFTPKLLDKHNVQLTLAVESKNDYGETHDFAVRQIVAPTGKPLEVAVGPLNLIFTPNVNQE